MNKLIRYYRDNVMNSNKNVERRAQKIVSGVTRSIRYFMAATVALAYVNLVTDSKEESRQKVFDKVISEYVDSQRPQAFLYLQENPERIDSIPNKSLELQNLEKIVFGTTSTELPIKEKGQRLVSVMKGIVYDIADSTLYKITNDDSSLGLESIMSGVGKIKKSTDGTYFSSAGSVYKMDSVGEIILVSEGGSKIKEIEGTGCGLISGANIVIGENQDEIKELNQFFANHNYSNFDGLSYDNNVVYARLNDLLCVIRTNGLYTIEGVLDYRLINLDSDPQRELVFSERGRKESSPKKVEVYGVSPNITIEDNSGGLSGCAIGTRWLLPEKLKADAKARLKK